MALSEFMPRIYGGIEFSDSKTKRKNTPTSSLDSLRHTMTLEQPIFNGWSSVSGLKAAQSSFRASRASFYDKEQSGFLDEIKIYLLVVSSKEKHTISKVSVRANKTQLEAMKEKFKLGESTATDVASAREGVATAESQQALAYAEYESTKANFERVFGVEAVNVRFPQIPENLPESLEELEKKALAANPSVGSAMHTTMSHKASENATKGSLLPSVTFRVQNSNTRYNPQQPAVSSSYINNRSTTSTLSVTVPILQKGGAEYSEIRRAKYRTRKSAINYDNEIKKTKANSKSIWSNLEAAKLRIKATSEAVSAAEVAYDGMIQEEMLGSKTIIDVLGAEVRLNKSREARIDARVHLITSSYKIKSLIGDLTAVNMNLKVDYFSPELEFKKVKNKIIGF